MVAWHKETISKKEEVKKIIYQRAPNDAIYNKHANNNTASIEYFFLWEVKISFGNCISFEKKGYLCYPIILTNNIKTSISHIHRNLPLSILLCLLYYCMIESFLPDLFAHLSAAICFCTAFFFLLFIFNNCTRQTNRSKKYTIFLFITIRGSNWMVMKSEQWIVNTNINNHKFISYISRI